MWIIKNHVVGDSHCLFFFQNMDSTEEYFPRSDNPIKEYYKRSYSNVRYVPDNEQLFKSKLNFYKKNFICNF